MKIKELLLAISVLLLASASLAHAEATGTNLFSIEAGSFRNGPALLSNSSSAQYIGWSLKYARTLTTGILLSQAASTDFLKIEGGFSIYQVVDMFPALGDETLVLPVSLVARYGMTFFETVEPYLFAGVLKNIAIAQNRFSSDIQAGPDMRSPQSALSTWQPAFGLGLAAIYRGFTARFDFGYEFIGGGIGYQF